MNYLEKELKSVVAGKEKLERRIKFLTKYCDWDFLGEVNTLICDHDDHFSMNIKINRFSEIKTIVEKYQPSSVLKNPLNSTKGSTENKSPFILTCGFISLNSRYSTFDHCIKLNYIVNEEFGINIEIPIRLCDKFLKETIRENPCFNKFNRDETQIELSIKTDLRIDCSEFGSGYSYVGYHKYYAATDFAALEMNKLLGLE